MGQKQNCFLYKQKLCIYKQQGMRPSGRKFCSFILWCAYKAARKAWRRVLPPLLLAFGGECIAPKIVGRNVFRR